MNTPFTLSITIRIEQRGPRGGRGEGITLTDEAEITGLEFMEVARVIAEFHELIQRVKENRRLLGPGTRESE